MVIDVVDGSEFRFIGRLPRRPKRRKEVREEIESTQGLIETLKAAGGNPIIVYGMSNALGYVVDRIIERAGSHGMISLLRFFGHGAPGMMSIAGAYGPDMSRHLADLGPRRRRMARRILSDLRPFFSPFGRVELHGCEVGRGRIGARFIRSLSQAFGVPVSAGIGTQYSEDASDAFRFEGPVRTAYPGGRIIKTGWRAVPGGYSGV